jgi:hypothetical protein
MPKAEKEREPNLVWTEDEEIAMIEYLAGAWNPKGSSENKFEQEDVENCTPCALLGSDSGHRIRA